MSNVLLSKVKSPHLSFETSMVTNFYVASLGISSYMVVIGKTKISKVGIKQSFPACIKHSFLRGYFHGNKIS